MIRAVIAVLAFVPVAVLVGVPSTLCGWLALGAWACACAAAANQPPWRRRLLGTTLAVTAMAITGCLRDANCRSVRTARVVSPAPLPSGPTGPAAPPALEETPAVSAALVDEEMLAVLGARLVVAGRRIPEPESQTLVDVMQDGYRRMKEVDGHVPTPMTGWVTAGVPDAIVIQPEEVESPSNAVVFLHGWGGSWVLPCWQVAQAARRAGAMTVCPATRFEGDWWSEQGQAMARAAIDAVRAQGARKVVLVGLSNGGAGASRIARKLRGELDGLVLISGVAADAAPSGLPTLVMHGTHDNMASPSTARQYAARTGARYVPFDGTHFVLLERHAPMTDALAKYLGERFEGRGR